MAIKVLVVVAMLVAGGCRDHTVETTQQPPGIDVDILHASIASRIDAPEARGDAMRREERLALTRLYGTSATALWTDASGRPSAPAAEALTLIEAAETEGLSPADYEASALRAAFTALSSPSARTTGDVAAFDVDLSTAMLRYYRHVHLGRVDPRTLGWKLDVAAESHDMAAVLRDAIARSRVVDAAHDLSPPLAQYGYLRDALARYRSLAATPERLPALEPPLHPGDAAPAGGLDVLAARLRAFGDLDAAAGTLLPANTYDEPLVAAVMRFQVRHGLAPDGVIGATTLAALRVPIAQRVRQIEMSLERLRWLPDLANERLIALNIPMFHLWAWSAARPGGVPELGMRAVVGRAVGSQTPIFANVLRDVVFRPYWNVPRSILLAESLPAIRKDPTYLARQHLELVEGARDSAPVVPATNENLERLRRGTLRLRQRPGADNALGLIKFNFPNTDDVYLHGTPAQDLFDRARRDFSHGCVRVEDPIALATWVLRGQGDWTRDRVVAATAATASSRVAVADPVRVVLFYLTAAVFPEDGTVHFARDIYGHDAVLDRALNAQ